MPLNLRKIISALSLGLACFSVQAQWEGNWLAGLSLGLAEREGNADLVIGHPQGLFSEFNQNQKDIGVIAWVLGGYQWRCNDWLFGAEVNVEWQELGRDKNGAFTGILNDGLTTLSRYHQGNIVALSGRFGYEMYPNFLPFVKLGVQSSRDKFSYTLTSPIEGAVNMEAMRRVYRLTAGVGAETPIPALMGLSLRGEYNFQARAGSIDPEVFVPENNSLVSANMRPRTNVFLISLVLNFV